MKNDNIVFEHEKDRYEKVVFQAGVYKERPFLDIRIFKKGHRGDLIPTQKGIRMDFNKRSLKGLRDGVKMLISCFNASGKKRNEPPRSRDLESAGIYSRPPDIDRILDDGDDDEYID